MNILTCHITTGLASEDKANVMEYKKSIDYEACTNNNHRNIHHEKKIEFAFAMSILCLPVMNEIYIMFENTCNIKQPRQ